MGKSVKDKSDKVTGAVSPLATRTLAAERKEVGIKDLLLLEDITERALLDNLRARFDDGAIYTYIGEVIVSVNPYRTIPGLYSRSQIDRYRGRFIFEPSLNPHLYAVTDTAYAQMKFKGEKQCVIISGESGSGKTEASKVLMQYVAGIESYQHGKKVEKISQQLLKTNPVLEAFGNAKTVRNDNSSRFGKYMDMQFARGGAPIGGYLTHYLLEKGRVVFQENGDRNFHVFYQLLKSGESEKFGLTKDAEDYRYLTRGNTTRVSGVDDWQNFWETKSGLGFIGFTEREQDEIFRIIAMVLMYGQIDFTQANDTGAAVTTGSSGEALSSLAGLLSVSVTEIAQGLVNKTIVSGDGSVFTTPLSVDQCAYSRDASAKTMYDRCFKWIVAHINKSINADKHLVGSLIGVLDIYGFEIFEINSFEQFCINYCNEKLQQLFIENMLRKDQHEYEAEGVVWTPVEYHDNQAICEMIDGVSGMYGLMEEEMIKRSSPTDDGLMKIFDSELKHTKYYASRAKLKDLSVPENEFTVDHYAGKVTYSVTGFTDKTADPFYKDAAVPLFKCGNSIVKQLFPEGDKSKWQQSSKRPIAVGTAFKRSMKEMVDMLQARNMSYVRCIKPNANKSPTEFDMKLVTDQVRALGLLENVKVRRAGYCWRQRFDLVVHRYQLLSERTRNSNLASIDPRTGTIAILDAMKVAKKDYTMGKTKLFIRHPQTVFAIEEAREVLIPKYVVKIQQWFRRKRYQAWLGAINKVYGACKSDPKFCHDKEWPRAKFAVVKEGDKYTQKIYRNWWAYKFITRLDSDDRDIYRIKLLATDFFQNKKTWDMSRKWSAFYFTHWRFDAEERTFTYGSTFRTTFVSTANKLSRLWGASSRVVALSKSHLHLIPLSKIDWKVSSFFNRSTGQELTNVARVSLGRQNSGIVIINSRRPGDDAVLDFGEFNRDHACEFAVRLYVACRSCDNKIEVEVTDSMYYTFNDGSQRTIELNQAVEPFGINSKWLRGSGGTFDALIYGPIPK